MYIHDQQEAELAAEIAKRWGFEYTPADFLEKYTQNVLNYEPNTQRKNACLDEIATALRELRAERAEDKAAF